MKSVIRPITQADIDEMVAEPLPHRIRAWAVEIDDVLQGIGGLVFMPNDMVAAFVMMKPGAARYKIALHKAGLLAMREAKRLGIPRVVALAQAQNPAAEPWLERLGFRPVSVDGEVAWVWTDRK